MDEVSTDQFDDALWRVGDVVTRDGNDEHKITAIDHDSGLLSVRCIKEPPVYEGSDEPWCRLGEIEHNLIRRYSWVRGGKACL